MRAQLPMLIKAWFAFDLFLILFSPLHGMASGADPVLACRGASKLITLSAVAILAGGANVALGSSMQGGSSLSHGSMKSYSIGGAYGRANPRELTEGATDVTRDRMQAREMMRDIPRVSSVGTDIRIDAYVPRSVRQAAVPLPPAVQRMHPRMRHSRAFVYRDQVVVANPATSRTVAIIKTPA
jgi:hypothetical protein